MPDRLIRSGEFEAKSAYEFCKSFLADRRGAVAVIRAFMDESGTHEGAPAVTSSVVWARPSIWKAWTADWCRELGPIKSYHSVDVHNREGEFEGWTRSARDEFVKRMLPIIPKHKLHGRIVGLDLNTYYNCLKGERKILEEFGNPYFACIHWAMRRVCEHAQKTRPDQQIAIVHECNQFTDYVTHAFKYTKERFPDLQMTLGFGSKESFVPLQAADIVAYEGYLVTKSGALIGVCKNHFDGWRFMPNNAAHQPSRKARQSATACIPKWAFEMSNDLLTADEWKRRNKPALDIVGASSMGMVFYDPNA